MCLCRYGALSTNFPIVLDDVDCSTNTYLTILQCRYSTFIDSNCDRGVDDVSVTCCTYYSIIMLAMESLWFFMFIVTHVYIQCQHEFGTAHMIYKFVYQEHCTLTRVWWRCTVWTVGNCV